MKERVICVWKIFDKVRLRTADNNKWMSDLTVTIHVVYSGSNEKKTPKSNGTKKSIGFSGYLQQKK